MQKRPTDLYNFLPLNSGIYIIASPWTAFFALDAQGATTAILLNPTFEIVEIHF